ncbi:MAG TPA: hypothetical protein VN783_12645 [Thermoanaerobaculia bacterium]|nr:hypothetical protein [Thermoanaerobaculia bacterium]
MKALEESRRRAEMMLAEARREAERRALAVREAVADEIGFVPKKKPLLLALAAGTVGFAMAFALRKRSRGRLRR